MAVSALEALRAIEQARVVVILRTSTAEEAVQAGQACLRGGLHVVEVTFTVPGALDAVARLAGRADALVGVGSVTRREQVREAAAAGARFTVSPHFDADILVEARAQGVLCLPGAATATEALGCHQAGAEAVKIFPVSAFGGPSYIKALLEPLPFLRLVPTGGVSESNLRAYLDAGAFAVGLGGGLVDRRLVARGEWQAIERRAAQIVEMVAAFGREQGGPTR
jgi:2-dehydro-3-deoxyphosphogluconate aldolase/(4S)-4-hydroxy-2-oxoglutarate aldolase